MGGTCRGAEKENLEPPPPPTRIPCAMFFLLFACLIWSACETVCLHWCTGIVPWGGGKSRLRDLAPLVYYIDDTHA